MLSNSLVRPRLHNVVPEASTFGTLPGVHPLIDGHDELRAFLEEFEQIGSDRVHALDSAVRVELFWLPLMDSNHQPAG